MRASRLRSRFDWEAEGGSALPPRPLGTTASFAAILTSKPARQYGIDECRGRIAIVGREMRAVVRGSWCCRSVLESGKGWGESKGVGFCRLGETEEEMM